MQKNIVILLLLLLWASKALSISRDSAAHYLSGRFGRHFTAARQLLANEGRGAAAIWQAQHLPERVLLAVVAPELMRYHSLTNTVEVISLEMLYVNFGRDYANFSVGWFQMKPAFAESLEKFALQHRIASPVIPADTADTKINREKRLERLLSLQGQAAYVALFYRVMLHRFPQWEWLAPEEQVRLLATAYNAGWQLSGEELQQFATRQFFSVTAWESPACNYAQVALHFFAWLKQE